jgi:predicted O-linked N-acetylglucosamine transferase (SPINDLY family)
LNDPKLRELTLSRFAENGLSSDRILILDFNFDNAGHYEQYNKIDIALDSFPYNGTTTTCDALYMGVPVITILGDRHCSRVSASLLTAVGLPELIAKDEDEFVKIAAELAQNTERLAKIKENLRLQVKNSVLCDQKSFADRWQNAILDMVREVRQETENF